MTTSSNLNLWLLGGIFVRYLSTKLPPNDVVKGRVVCNILFSTPLRILGECPSQSVQFSKNVLHHFGKPCVFKFTSRHYISSGVYNSASSSDAMFGKKDVTYLLTYLRTQSNLRTSLPCTTSLVVAGSNLRTSLRSYVTDRSGSKAYCNDQL